MNNRFDVIVVGSGMAGMAAADLLSKHELKVLVVDENTRPGGQLLRQPFRVEPSGGRWDPDPVKRRGLRLSRRLKTRDIRFVSDAQALGIFPGRTLLIETRGETVSEYRAGAIILATGAREKHLPFKGWTLPGVMSTGAAQILMKSARILPAKKTLIGGCGPLMLVTAAEILMNHGEVQAVLDQSSPAIKLGMVTAGSAIWPKLIEGAVHLVRLGAARVPLRQGVRVVEARGHRHLETVVAARIDSRGRIVQGTEQVYPAEALAVGYGFSPNIELPRQAGCSLSYKVDRGGWHVDVSRTMATSVPDIYAAGEITGIAGAGKSFVEGQIAAWDILLKKGRVDRQTHHQHIRPLLRRRDRQIRYGRFLNRLCQIEPGCYSDIPDETMICRCEEITMGEIRRHLKDGFTTMNGIKRATRCGMGNCQGRTCGPILFEIIGAFRHRSSTIIGCTSARAPVKTMGLGALARMTKTGGGEVEDQGIGLRS